MPDSCVVLQRILWHRTTNTRQICGVFRQPDMKWRYIETIILD
ncbi:hypothetical protein HMPREF3196_00262 [Bifidobacterium bifidum]|uniref:Uncharacterized protein n=1 Tax=Bifidobacterium bifidum TaxID=1681 RepID=A0A133KSJ4_BIFBI|nr:hypothetical protein BIFBIF_01852 [Bifidobacterium bifidum ATCC 29521 = JCM 1255 = DSM 20456]KWZ82505.1 hypothetical protein HMPREF3196_00262 [Bifidobacterium bifidum]